MRCAHCCRIRQEVNDAHALQHCLYDSPESPARPSNNSALWPQHTVAQRANATALTSARAAIYKNVYKPNAQVCTAPHVHVKVFDRPRAAAVAHLFVRYYSLLSSRSAPLMYAVLQPQVPTVRSTYLGTATAETKGS